MFVWPLQMFTPIWSWSIGVRSVAVHQQSDSTSSGCVPIVKETLRIHCNFCMLNSFIISHMQQCAQQHRHRHTHQKHEFHTHSRPTTNQRHKEIMDGNSYRTHTRARCTYCYRYFFSLFIGIATIYSCTIPLSECYTFRNKKNEKEDRAKERENVARICYASFVVGCCVSAVKVFEYFNMWNFFGRFCWYITLWPRAAC